MLWTLGGNFTIPCSVSFALSSLGYNSMITVGTDLKVGLKFWKYYGTIRDAGRAMSMAARQIAELQARVADSEKRLERCPGEGCPRCGLLEYRVDSIEQAGMGERKVNQK